MAKMIKLNPVPREPLPADGWELIATEAGRYGVGMRTTIQVWNGNLQGATQIAVAYPETWTEFLTPLARQMGMPIDALRSIVFRLAGAAEGLLRQAEEAAEIRKKSHARDLVGMAADAELFHDPMGEAYATVDVDGHAETWPVKTKGFRLWLARRYYQEHEETPGGQAVKDALAVLEGRALFDGAEIPVHLRLAEVDGTIYLDLANDHWEAIEITRDGWKIVPHPPVKFRRTRGMLPLPHPATGGELDDLLGPVDEFTGSAYGCLYDQSMEGHADVHPHAAHK